MSDDNDGVLITPTEQDANPSAVATSASLGELLLRNKVVSVVELNDARELVWKHARLRLGTYERRRLHQIATLEAQAARAGDVRMAAFSFAAHTV